MENIKNKVDNINKNKKYVLIIIDGAADNNIKKLQGKTPISFAHIPFMDSIACMGISGTVNTIPNGFSPGSDVAILSLLGLDPAVFHTGRAPLEAAAMDLKVSEDEWVFRCNLVSINNGIMSDHSAGNISNKDGNKLIHLIDKNLKKKHPVRFYTGVSYRNLMVLKGDIDVVTTPPHDIIDKPVNQYLPLGKGSDLLRDLITQSRIILKKNRSTSASSIWLWGQGKPPSFKSFYERFGVKGAIISAVDLVKGIGKLMGMDYLAVSGATGYIDTNYKGKGTAAIKALSSYDFICIHIEAPDEAGHKGDALEKVRTLEEIDNHIVGPVLENLKNHYKNWRILIMPDHPTPCAIRTHTSDPVPFCMAGSDVLSDSIKYFSEFDASCSKKHISQGYKLMNFFITPSKD